MDKKHIKAVESKEEFCRKVEQGEIEKPEEWYVRHPNNPSLLKRVTSVDEMCALEDKEYSQEEIEEFRKHFQVGDKTSKVDKVEEPDKSGEVLWKK